MPLYKEVNWDETYSEALDLFKTLIRFETVNPPGNEKPAIQYLADLFAREGLSPETFDSAENRSNVVCRLRGTGEKPPLLLNGHLDVVQVEPDKWTVPPFEAVEKDGFLYGRGTVDMKNMVTMSAMSLVLMKRAGIKPKRDLIFLGVSDEEAGGEFGSRFMVENHPDKIKAEYAVGEVGGFSMEIGGRRFYLIQVAEKGVCWLRIKTKGDPGHGSIPDPRGALIKAAEIAARLGARRLPQHNAEAVVKFVQLMSANMKFPKSMVFKALLNPSLSGLLLDKVMPDRDMALAFSAMLHNTANPTVIRAGEKTNVMPSEATLEVDGRILPGSSREEFLAEVRAIIGEEAEIDVISDLTPTSAPVDDPIMDSFKKVILRKDPEAAVVPNLVTGFTDASHYKKLGMKCYGFSPLRLPADVSFKTLAHGHDERIPLDGFRFGLETLFEAVEEIIT